MPEMAERAIANLVEAFSKEAFLLENQRLESTQTGTPQTLTADIPGIRKTTEHSAQTDSSEVAPRLARNEGLVGYASS